MALDIRTTAHGTPDYDAAVILRRAVLRTPLGLDFSPQDLAREAGDTHFTAWHEGRLAGTVVMTPYAAGKVKLRQMAVSEAVRGEHVGARLLAAFEAHARAHGISEIVLAARTTAQGFYARYGYETDDEVFSEVTIPHIRMWKRLYGVHLRINTVSGS